MCITNILFFGLEKMNFYFGIFLVAVSLGGGVAEDPLCLVQVLSEVNPIRFFINPDFVCQNVKHTFELVDSNIKQCTYQTVDVSKLKSLHEDFCDADSDFSRDFAKHRACFLDRMADNPTCYDRWLNDPDKSVKETCSNLIAETTECLNRGVREVCGDSSLEVYKRMNDAQVPLLAAICVEMNGMQMADAAGRYLMTWLIVVSAFVAAIWHQN